MCIIVCMKKRATYKITPQQALELRDMAEAAQYHALPTDTRIQVKMPKAVVKTLDALFPDVNRSQLLTKLALDAIVRKLRFIDNPELDMLVDSEQSDLDDLWEYLEERERNV